VGSRSSSTGARLSTNASREYVAVSSVTIASALPLDGAAGAGGAGGALAAGGAGGAGGDADGGAGGGGGGGAAG
jgi:hypothetical protein